MSHASVILITLIVYKVVLIGIGFWAQRRIKDTQDYFVGGRQLGPFVASLSYAASSSSAWSLLGVSGAAFSMGLPALWMVPGVIGAHIVGWFWIAPRLRQHVENTGAVSLTDVLSQSVGPGGKAVAWVASIIIVFCFLFYVASQFQAAGKTFEVNFDLSSATAIGIGAAIILVYTWLGGFWAVSVTDALQAVLMVLASIALPTAALIAVGGFDALLAGLDAPALTQWHGGFGPLLGLGFALGLLAIGLGAFGQPHLLNRFMALADERALKTGRILAISWFALVLIGMVVLGLCARVLVPSASDGEAIFFSLTNQLFPPIIAGVFTAAVLSAIMSTADSQLLVTAAAVSNDLKLSEGSPRKQLLISRLAMAGVCVLATVVATQLPATIFARVLFAWNGLGAAFGPLVFALLLGWRISARTMITAMVAGAGLTVVFYTMPNTPGDWLERIIPFVVSAMIVYMGRVFGARPEDGDQMT